MSFCHLKSFFDVGEDALIPRVEHQLANDALLTVFRLCNRRRRLPLKNCQIITFSFWLKCCYDLTSYQADN